MTKNITLAVDEDIVAEARVLAAENRTTVNAMVRDFLAAAVAKRRSSKGAQSGFARAHERMTRLAEEGRGKYADRKLFDREEIYDRDYGRAELYMQNRAALLKLIDETTADMGSQQWNRQALYDR